MSNVTNCNDGLLHFSVLDLNRAERWCFSTITIVAETIFMIFDSITIDLFNNEIVNSTNKGATKAKKVKQCT